MYTNRVEITFDAGHRLLDYPGKCASPHGHTYRAEVIVASDELDPLGLGVDFGEIKRRCKDWIDKNWDHGFLLNGNDSRLIEALRTVPEAKLYFFPDQNPSAEAMARELYGAVEEFGWQVQCIRVWESPNQFAEYVPGGVSSFAEARQEAVR